MNTITKEIGSFPQTYSLLEIKDKLLVTFDSHNMALPVWGAYSNSIGSSCQLITFDSHSDTLIPFTDLLSSCGEHIGNDYAKKECVQAVLQGKNFQMNSFDLSDVIEIASSLSNDEHIKAAVDWHYISRYFVITSDINIEMNQRYDRSEGYDCVYLSKEDWFRNTQACVDDTPTVIDFDLDYFTHIRDFETIKSEAFKKMIQKARLITIAREPNCFNECKVNQNDISYTNDVAFDMLVSLLRETV